MPNPTAGRGFALTRMQGGRPVTGALSPYKIASGTAANFGSGDPVKLLASGYVTGAAATDQIRGILVAVRYVGADGVPVYANKWTSGTVTLGAQDAEAIVVDDADAVFEARLLNSSAVQTQAIVGATMDGYAVAAPDVLGNSTAGLDVTTAGTAGVWRILGFVETPDNDLAAANPVVLVAPAKHDFRVNTGI